MSTKTLDKAVRDVVKDVVKDVIEDDEYEQEVSSAVHGNRGGIIGIACQKYRERYNVSRPPRGLIGEIVDGEMNKIKNKSNMRDLDEYQDVSRQTAEGFTRFDNSDRPDWWQDGEEVYRRMCLLFVADAINGEAGEFAEKIKKYVREGDEKYLEQAEDELGDILWYLARGADGLDTSLGEIGGGNLEKLFDRKERDVIRGQGDNR